MTFGWDYPPGALNDPRAPYNAADAPEPCDALHPDGIIYCAADAGHPGMHYGIDSVWTIVQWPADEYEDDEC